MTATFGLAGNTMVVSHVGAVAAAAATTKKWEVAAVDAYSTVAITRDLTSGATLSATYKSTDDSLTLPEKCALIICCIVNSSKPNPI